jgi:hypothetical protein
MIAAMDAMALEREGLDRLQTLIGHLMWGQLTVRTFRMDAWREVRDGAVVGCAAGECVRLWPIYWHFSRTHLIPGWRPVLRGSEMGGTTVSLGLFFNLPYEESLTLFTIGRGDDRWRAWRGWPMEIETTRARATQNLQRYLDWRHQKAKAWALTASFGEARNGHPAERIEA